MIDPTHQMGALFGVVNIPNVVWIDEEGVIVRPPEPGWPDATSRMPADMAEAMAELPQLGRAPHAPVASEGGPSMWEVLRSGQDRAGYGDTIRDWVRNGPASSYALSPEQVVARSQPRTQAKSEGAAHFELANHLWRLGEREAAIAHFNASHRLQPENWTYKRQAWSLIGEERTGGKYGRWIQAPRVGEEADWPFDSDFTSDVLALELGGYYPDTHTQVS